MSNPNAIFLTIIFLLCSHISNGQLSLNSIAFPDKIEEGKFQFYSIAKDDEDHSEQYTCTWDMGDGVKRLMHNQFELGHTFRDDGNYTISFKAKDSKDHEVAISQQVKVINLPPEVRFLDGKVENSSNRRVKFEAIAYDPGSDELTYTWDFGDGNIKEGKQLTRVMHTYDAPGVYKVRVTVDDGDGGSDYKEMTMSVETDWHATITGDYNFELSGGAGLMYQTRIDTATKEIVSCLKMFTFYDDNNNSFLNVGSNTFKRLAGETHTVGPNHKENFMVLMRHDMKASLYANMSSHFRMQEVREDYKVLTGKSFEALNMFSDMREAIRTGENIYGLQFREISGTLKVEPIKGNRLKGQMNALLETEVKGADGKSVTKQIHIDLLFNVRVNDVAKYHMEHGCEEVADPFFITDYSPRDGKVNVYTKNSCIEVEFSEAVDPLSITNSSILLGYYNTSNVFVPEHVGIEYVNEKRIKIIPSKPLRDAVKYEVFINKYNDIRSIEGGELADKEQWSFSTQVIPSDYSVRVYQTLADAPLIEGKNTMVRVVLKWGKPDDVHEKSFVNEFPATVTLKSSTGKILGEETDFIIQHQENFNTNDVRLMTNSMNIFSWKPKISDGKEITIDIKPDFQECLSEEKQIKFRFKHNVDYFKEAPSLEIDYYYLQIDSLEDYIPLASDQLGTEIMERAARFSKQILPIKNVKINNKKGYKISVSLFKDMTETEGIIYMTEVMWNNYLLPAALEKFYLDVGVKSKADIVLLFVPIKLHNYRAAGLAHLDSINKKPIIPWGKKFIYSDMYVGHLKTPSITHEIGHTMFLEHKPYVKDGDERKQLANMPMIAMENHKSHVHISGCRIFDNGVAYNKDCREGNGEIGYVNNFMFPNLARVKNETSWIDPEQYDKLIEHFKLLKNELGVNLTENQNDYYWASTNKISRKYNEDLKTIYIKGEIDKVSNMVSIQYVKAAKSRPEISERAGAYMLECIDSKGVSIGKKSFNPDEDLFPGFNKSTIPFYNFIEVPSISTPKKILIKLKGKVLAEYQISDNAPSLELLSPLINDTISERVKLSWQASDLDGDDLTYSLFYTPGDLNDWQMKGITKEQKMEFNTSELTSGPSPTFKVVASDGFHETEAIVSIHIDFPFTIDWMTPTYTADVTDDIKITFSNAVIPSADANQWFRFLGRDSIGIIYKVPYEVEYNEDYKSVTLIPHHDLDPSLDYRISYGIKPPKPVEADVASSKDEPKKRKRPLKDFLAKQVDKLTADDENEENSNVLKEILGLPTKEVPKKDEEVKEERGNVLADMLGLNDVEEKEEFTIKDVFGNELKGYYSSPFRLNK